MLEKNSACAEGPGGYVVITFTHERDEDERECDLNRCVMSADWFNDDEAASEYMATLPEWTVSHCLTLTVRNREA